MPERPGNRTGRSPAKGGRPRRASRHIAPGRLDAIRAYLAHPGFIPTSLVVVGLLVSVIAVIGLARGRVLAVEGRVVDETRVVRAEFRVVDPVETARRREAVRLLAPRVYRADEAAQKELQSSLAQLPTALAAAESLDQVAVEIREAFALSQEQLRAIRQQGSTEEGQAEWTRRVGGLMARLNERPMLANEEYQLVVSDPARTIEARPAGEPGAVGEGKMGGGARMISEDRAINVGATASDLRQSLDDLARFSGFTGPLASLVVQRLTFQPRPLFVYDRGASKSRADAEASAIPEATVTYHEGDVIVRRGERLSSEAHGLLVRESEAFFASRSAGTRAARWGGVLGVSVVIVTAFGLYLRLFYPGLGHAPGRFAGLTALVGLGAAGATGAAVLYPGSFWPAAVTPVMFVTMICVVVFDTRLGIAVAATLVAIIGSAIAPPIGYFPVVMVGAGIAAWKLREIRSRNDVVRAASLVAIGVAASAGAVGLQVRPLVDAVWMEIVSDALSAGAGGFVAGAFVLVVLPAVERMFDVTTGMTLSELRDPKQPLLRRLQQMAPGTFNHSHMVATLAEAAADSIGADGLHVYVGALYHDIGKMNKPDYFIENQARGHNRHTRLSPAMSLLVIVGHVKDGVELAREFRLPRSLLGYIETHHGTTLVEYFFDVARRQAEDAESGGAPEEVEYRYPGPKPRTREQAILMLCDCVESATRAMPEPTPSRISALVHQLATKRLMDGQFDDCNLTLREVRLIEDAISKALASIYHGRIAYPKEESKESAGSKEQGPATRAAVEQAG